MNMKYIIDGNLEQKLITIQKLCGLESTGENLPRWM